MASGVLNFQYNGGAAVGQFNSQSGQSLTVNANPLFGGGTNSPGGASSTDSPAQAPSVDQAQGVPAFPGTSAAPILAGGASPLGSSPLTGSGWLLILLVGGALILTTGGGGSHR